VSNFGRPLNRHAVTRMVRRIAKRAGIGHVHPHQLRHTLATQCLNRGMSLEAVAQLLGHQSLKWTVFYARLSDRTLAEQFRSVADHVDALYAPETDGESEQMRKLRLEHSRLLANGWCTRPKEMDCQFDSICEGCGFFATTVEFKPTLIRQRDHAAEHGQPERAAIFEELLEGLDEEAS